MQHRPGIPPNYRFGVVEGFFGQPWSWEARYNYAKFLRSSGFNSYLYAPKADSYLRKGWGRPFPKEHEDSLRHLANHYANHQLDFGVGISPYEIYLNFDNPNRMKLLNKLTAINDIGAKTLCLLFDDMPGNFANLAERQCEVMTFVMSHSEASHYIFCPTYYSFDPVLSEQFGTPPENYLEKLGMLLPKDVDVFWTGPKVVSRDYPSSHLTTVKALLKRKPLIWDNYPVNDSEYMCDFIHVSTPEYDIETLKSLCNGHFSNPMNQPWLSTIALKSLAMKYFDEAHGKGLLAKPALEVMPTGLYQLFEKYLSVFETLGLKKIDNTYKQEIKREFSAWPDYQIANEIAEWLDGKYEFDPDCLT